MLSELLRFSSASHLLSSIPEEMQAHHRVSNPVRVVPAAALVAGAGLSRTLGRAGRLLQTQAEKQAAPAPAPARQNLWDGWACAQPAEADPFAGLDDEDGEGNGEDLDLNALGL